MGKIYNSLKISVLFLLLTSSVLASFWNNSTSNTYIFPQEHQPQAQNWAESPYGIFSAAFQECSLSASLSSTNITCNGNSDGSINISGPSGGSGSYQYSIDNGNSWQDSGNFQNLAPGSYQVLITDKSDTSCRVTLSPNLEISQPNFLTLTNSTSTPVSCNGGNDGTANVGTVAGGNSGYTYSINGGGFSTATTFSNLSAGDHIITVRDSKGCETSETVTISQPDVLTITNSTSTPVSCNGDNDGKVTVGTVAGGNSGYTYSINGGSFSTATTFSNLSAGDHVITVKDSKGCEASETLTVSQPNVLTLTNSTTTPVSCNGGSDGKVTVGTASGGNSGYTYSINGGGFSTATTFNNLSAGDHVITVKDSKGCEASETVNVSQPDVLTLTNSTSTPVSCNGGNDGKVTVGTVTGGNSGYTYSINGGSFSTATTFNNLSAGDHVITVKNSKGCEASETITISQPDVLTLIGSTTTPVSCNGGNDGKVTVGTVAGGNSGYTYSINGGSFSTATTFSNLSAGDHVITVKDSKGCEASETVTIYEPDVLTLTNSTTTSVSCNGGNDGKVTVGTVTGGNSGYTYSINGGSFSTATTFSNLSAGDHVITVKDSKGCEASETITISQPDVLTLIGSTTTPVSCNGGSDGTVIVGTVAGGNSGYTYSINGGDFSTATTFSNLSAGDHVITVKDSKGCEASETVNVSQPDVLTLTNSTSTPVSCNGGNDGKVTVGTVAGGNSGYTYSINGGSFSTATTFNNLSAGDHVITVKDSKGCEASETVTISQPDVLTLRNSTTTPVSCNGGNDGKVTVGTVAGGNSGYTYSINGGNFSTATTFNNLSAGDHVITVKDSKDCETSETVTISQPDVLTLTNSTTTPVSCNGGNDGKVTVGTASGGNSGYTYSINGSGFSTATTFSNLSAGDHVITVKDSKGCEASETVTISEPNVLTLTNSTTTPVSCNGGSDGKVTVGTVTGGTTPYEFSVDNENFYSTKLFENLPAGNHTIFVKDANECSIQVPVTVSQPALLTAQITKTDVGCANGNSGAINISNASGGHGSYEYSIDGSNWKSSSSFSGLNAGTYSVAIRDAAYPNCIVVLNSALKINQPAQPLSVVNTNIQRTTTYGTATGSATVDFTGGTPGYTYEWRKKGETAILQTTKTANYLVAGEYEVTVTDNKGCKLTTTVHIYDAIHAPIIPTSVCGSDTDIIRTSYFEVEDLSAKGGVGPYTYSWNFGANATPATATGPGSHKVIYSATGNKDVKLTVTDATGVSKTISIIHYAGECFVDDCGSNDFEISPFYIGDANGNKITSETCDDDISKFIYFNLPSGPTRYSLYMEYIFSIEHPNGEVTRLNRGRCLYDKQAIPQKVKTIEVDWNCGDILVVENVYLTFSNNSKWTCGQGPNPKCYSTNSPETVQAPLFVTVTANELLCYGSKNGTVTAKASGGKAPYYFSITGSNGTYQSSNVFNSLEAGTYTVWVKDSEGKKFESEAVEIIQPLAPITINLTSVNPACYGEKGKATASPQGGTPFIDENGNSYYEYLWNDPTEQTTATAINLLAGNYTVTVIDANGCQAIVPVTITQPEQLTVAETGPDQTFGCGFYDTVLEANTPVTGVGTWTVIDAPNSSWTLAEPNSPTSAFSAPAGIYTLRWTIAHADGTCGTSSDMTVNFKGDCSTLDFDGVDDYVYIGDRNNFSSDFSMEVWIRPKSVQGLKTIISKRNTAALTSSGYDLVINNGAPTFRWNGNSVSTSHKLSTTRWYHLAVVFKGSSVELYVDGIKVGNSTGSKPTANSFPFLIGAMYNAENPEVPQNYFKGWMEELRVWNTALSVEQIRFMMNQRIEPTGSLVKGIILPMNVPETLSWSSLASYYRLIAEDAKVAQGIAVDRANNGVDGHLRNIESLQQNTAPLPYISEADGAWKTRTAWDVHIGDDGENFWTWPNDKGINGENINWNIAYVTHEQNSGSQNITLLGFLLNGGKLDMLGENPVRTSSGIQPGTGNGLTITKYLDLGGFIDLNGESQLVQTQGSILVGNGSIQKDQQGTASSYNYNYWTSPVSISGQNSGYKIASVLKDGTDPTDPKIIDFNYQFHWADKAMASPIKISSYWLHKFFGDSNEYSQWEKINESTTLLKSGEGYSMKGSSGYSEILDLQNYVFTGMPNNDTISLNITTGKNYLIGNPYPSAIDANEFILDNLKDRRNGTNVFNGSLYFWSHFSGNTHYLPLYIGGYAVYNLSGGIRAIANDERINATGDEGGERPQQYIPVAQAFFVSTALDESITSQYGVSIDGGEILFRNSQRFFVSEIDPTKSVFHSQEKKGLNEPKSSTAEGRKRIWIKFRSPEGYHRQLLVTADENTTSGFDLGYDAPLIENNREDMYWLFNELEAIIQGVPDFGESRVLPFGIKTSKGGQITIAIDELENISENAPIFVKDNDTDTYHNLQESDFTAEVAAGNIHDRYAIVFKDNQPSEEDPGDPDEGGDDDGNNGGDDSIIIEKPQQPQPSSTGLEVLYLGESKQLVIKNYDLLPVKNVILYNTMGQAIYSYSKSEIEQGSIIKLPVEVPVKGMYVVRVYLEDSSVALKFLVD
ncbi:LamG-like jellyroll fold domain-containing protein [Salinimicrobium sp. TIG7-5_MAKvit]|uniref:LamG-like jellyroll fold domain-containing protein n=1 Tax=Salinimicrobium sp. TIG7-5_MAKvit TaxID=3121289 RepID=UPI003C6E8374